MIDLQQKIRWSKEELELIKVAFSGEGEKLLYQIRDVLFQFSNDIPSLSTDALKVIRKMVLPTLDKDLPLGLQADLRNAIGGNPQTPGIKDVHPEVAINLIRTNDLVIEYLSQRLDVLEGKEVAEPILLQEMTDKKKPDSERLVSMMAYLFLENAYIDGSLMALRDLANLKEETEEEKKVKATKNSSK